MKYSLLFILGITGICMQCLGQRSVKILLSRATPSMVSEGVINTPMNERDIAISPDGTEMFYTVLLQPTLFHTILHCKKDKTGRWSAPEVASFSGQYSDMEPAFSPDGQKLFFSSDRLYDSTKTKNYDIWYVQKLNGKWMNPKNIGAPVNTPANEFFPSVTSSGNLYFTAAYQKGIGKEDIYMCKWENGKYSQSTALDTAVNSTLYEFNAFVSADEKFILFTSYGRNDDKGRGDLYISRKDGQGKWMQAKNLEAINSESLDYCPFVSFDCKTLFFTSERHSIPASFAKKPATYDQLKKLYQGIQNGTGNIYQIDWEAVAKTIH